MTNGALSFVICSSLFPNALRLDVDVAVHVRVEMRSDTADHEIASRLLEVHRLDTVDDRTRSPGWNRREGYRGQRKVLQDPRVGSAVYEVSRVVDQRWKWSEGREI